MTRPGSRPSSSADSWVMTVYVPVPMSVTALRTYTVPSRRTVTLARQGAWYQK